MVAEQNWGEAYKELSQLIIDPTGPLSEIKHVDLFFEQINNQDEEYPFPEHSVFIDFNADKIETTGKNVQDMNMIVTFYHAFDTLSDSFEGSDNQTTALEFINVNRKIHKLLQGKHGVHFSKLDRVAFGRYRTDSRGVICYFQSYACIIRDYAPYEETQSVQIGGVSLNNNPAPPQNQNIALYQVDL